MENTPMRPGRNGGLLKTGNDGRGGRPKKLPSIDKVIADVLGEEKNDMTGTEAILRSLRNQAIKGNIRAAEILLNRAYGTPVQSVHFKSDEDKVDIFIFMPNNPLLSGEQPGEIISIDK